MNTIKEKTEGAIPVINEESPANEGVQVEKERTPERVKQAMLALSASDLALLILAMALIFFEDSFNEPNIYIPQGNGQT